MTPFKIISTWVKARSGEKTENVLFNHLLELAYLPVMGASWFYDVF